MQLDWIATPSCCVECVARCTPHAPPLHQPFVPICFAVRARSWVGVAPRQRWSYSPSSGDLHCGPVQHCARPDVAGPCNTGPGRDRDTVRRVTTTTSCSPAQARARQQRHVAATRPKHEGGAKSTKPCPWAAAARHRRRPAARVHRSNSAATHREIPGMFGPVDVEQLLRHGSQRTPSTRTKAPRGPAWSAPLARQRPHGAIRHWRRRRPQEGGGEAL